MHALKSRLEDVILFRETYGMHGTYEAVSTVDTIRFMQSWHKLELGGLNSRLKAMRLFPHFFRPPNTTRMPGKVDGTAFVDRLRGLTEAVDRSDPDPVTNVVDKDEIWNEGEPTRLLLAFVNTHVRSFSEIEKEDATAPVGNPTQQQLPSDWCGGVAATGLHLHSVLSMSNAGRPVERRLLRRVLLILGRDIDQTREEMEGSHGETRRNFWFWKAFTGALALVRSQKALDHAKKVIGNIGRGGDTRDLRDLQERFKGYLRDWGEVAGVTTWLEARAALMSITWPTASSTYEEPFAEALWNGVVG